MRLALAALVLPPLGPRAWRIANAELAAIRSGRRTRSSTRRPVFAKVCAIVGTLAPFAVVATAFACC